MRNMTMTEDDFIAHEMRVWDYEYVENLLNAEYRPVLTTAGWKWVAPDSPLNRVSDQHANDESATS